MMTIIFLRQWSLIPFLSSIHRYSNTFFSQNQPSPVSSIVGMKNDMHNFYCSDTWVVAGVGDVSLEIIPSPFPDFFVYHRTYVLS